MNMNPNLVAFDPTSYLCIKYLILAYKHKKDSLNDEHGDGSLDKPACSYLDSAKDVKDEGSHD